MSFSLLPEGRARLLLGQGASNVEGHRR